MPGHVDASHLIAAVALVTAGGGGRASQDIASVGAAHLEGGAAQATLALARTVLWRAGGGALTAWTPSLTVGSERAWSRHRPSPSGGRGNYRTVSSIKPSHGFCEHPYAH